MTGMTDGRHEPGDAFQHLMMCESDTGVIRQGAKWTSN